MHVIAAPERYVQCARGHTIVGERSLAGQQPPIFDAFDPRADVFRPKTGDDVRVCEHDLAFARVCHRRSGLSPAWVKWGWGVKSNACTAPSPFRLAIDYADNPAAPVQVSNGGPRHAFRCASRCRLS